MNVDRLRLPHGLRRDRTDHNFVVSGDLELLLVGHGAGSRGCWRHAVLDISGLLLLQDGQREAGGSAVGPGGAAAAQHPGGRPRPPRLRRKHPAPGPQPHHLRRCAHLPLRGMAAAWAHVIVGMHTAAASAQPGSGSGAASATSVALTEQDPPLQRLEPRSAAAAAAGPARPACGVGPITLQKRPWRGWGPGPTLTAVEVDADASLKLITIRIKLRSRPPWL